MSDNNAFLRIAFYQNYRAYPNDVFFFFEFFGINLDTVRNFFFVVQKNFLAYGFIYKKRSGLSVSWSFG